MWKFKEEHSLDERKNESGKIAKFWPDKIPIILEKREGSKLAEVPKAKLLCPRSYTFSQFLMCLRMKIKLNKEDSLFVFLNKNELVTGDKSIAALYEDSKDEDGFLYLMYCEHVSLG
jgi:GABA(A) receptor-associated protein